MSCFVSFLASDLVTSAGRLKLDREPFLFGLRASCFAPPLLLEHGGLCDALDRGGRVGLSDAVQAIEILPLFYEVEHELELVCKTVFHRLGHFITSIPNAVIPAYPSVIDQCDCHAVGDEELALLPHPRSPLSPRLGRLIPARPSPTTYPQAPGGLGGVGVPEVQPPAPSGLQDPPYLPPDLHEMLDVHPEVRLEPELAEPRPALRAELAVRSIIDRAPNSSAAGSPPTCGRNLNPLPRPYSQSLRRNEGRSKAGKREHSLCSPPEMSA